MPRADDSAKCEESCAALGDAIIQNMYQESDSCDLSPYACNMHLMKFRDCGESRHTVKTIPTQLSGTKAARNHFNHDVPDDLFTMRFQLIFLASDCVVPVSRNNLRKFFLKKLLLLYSIHKILKKRESESILGKLLNEVRDHSNPKRCRKEAEDPSKKAIGHPLKLNTWDMISKKI